MVSLPHTSPLLCHYFVDEAGDLTLFNHKGRVIIGNEGCSKFFILGFVEIPDPVTVDQELTKLRNQLLADPYFRRVPSMLPENAKTAFFFHAKDDPAEIRWQVFSLLRRHPELRFHAVVRDKHGVLAYVRQSNLQDPAYRYHPNDQYDYLVRQLFRHVLHQREKYQIVFAKRGQSDRTTALQHALQTAQQQFNEHSGIAVTSTILVQPSIPQFAPGLQVADYFLWAVQRLYEKADDRYVEYLQNSIRYVHDLDDVTEQRTGTRYTQKKPLTKAALQNRASNY